MNQSMVEQPQCLKPAQHEQIHHFFCITCANKNININSLSFCAKCYPKKHKDHRDHIDYYSIGKKQFQDKVMAFRRYLETNKQEYSAYKNRFMANVMDNQKLSFMDMPFKKWLVAAKFWKFQDHKTMKEAHENFLKLITKSSNISESPEKKQTQSKSTLIDWSSVTDQKQGSIFQQMYKQAEAQKKQLQENQKKTDLLLQIFTALQPTTKQLLLSKITTAIEEYPEDWALLLGKLYLMELYEGNKDQWMPLLKKAMEINPKLRQSEVGLYLESQQFWVKLGKKDLEGAGNQVRFVDTVTGNVFKLTKPQEYTNMLNTALIREGNPPALLQAAKAIGLLAQGKHPQALKTLQSLQSQPTQRTQCSQMTKYLTQTASNPSHKIPIPQLLSQLQNKSKQYIINAIKYLRKQNLPDKVIQCCKVLNQQGNYSTFAKIQCVKALLRLGLVEDARQVRADIGAVADGVMGRLKRKEVYTEARIAAQNGNKESATKLCQDLVREKQSASAYFSLASSLYNQQQYEQAQANINKAVSLKPCPKYLKLKLYIQIMKKQLQEAKKILLKLPPNSMPPEITEMLMSL